jgi:GNAT superfamily N-acetyltransferase
MPPTIEALEQAGFNAWPALRTEMVGGWLVRTADGYTKRANSANYVKPGYLPIANLVAGCVARFEIEALRPIFRIVERSETEPVERHLAEEGWESLDPSLVLVGNAGHVFARHDADRDWALLPLEAWAACHARLSGQDDATAARHLRLLSAIDRPTFPAVMRADSDVVACGLAVADAGLLGFFDIYTDARHRGRGLARRLMAGQADAARSLGIDTLYLQVVAANAPAIALYRKLGFSEAYRYHYRARP